MAYLKKYQGAVHYHFGSKDGGKNKLMRFGLTNWIVNDSDFKVVNLDRSLRSDSKSNDESESKIAISI